LTVRFSNDDRPKPSVMLSFGLFQVLSLSTSTLSEVLSGNWSGHIIYSRNSVDDLDLNLVVTRADRPNYLSTQIYNDIALINLSFVALAGNITFRDRVFDFNLTQTAPPFLSSNIDMGEFGLLHFTLGSDVGIRCLYTRNGTALSIMFRKTGFAPYTSSSKFLSQNWKKLCMIACFLLAQFGFRRYSAKLKADNARKAALVEAEKAEMANAQALANESSPPTNPDGVGKLKTE
jgi:hypothetical protein